jgi:serine/threonine protein kinase
MSTSSPSEWVSTAVYLGVHDLILCRRLRSCLVQPFPRRSLRCRLIGSSSAKDQLTGTATAIKKIMKPFSTPVLAKRTYRELKLLKHIQHENVRRVSHSPIAPDRRPPHRSSA